MMNPQSYQFSDEIHQILFPHVLVLGELLEHNAATSSTILHSQVPALDCMRETRSRSMLGHLGDIDIADFGRIVNWIYMKIPGARHNLHKWLVSPLTAHAITLVLKERHKLSFMEDTHFPAADTPDQQHSFLLQKAWKYQVTHTRPDAIARDVDLECLYLFERRLFSAVRNEVSTYEQWGLDAGDHQQKWYPYQDLPPGWCEEGIDFDCPELLVSNDARI